MDVNVVEVECGGLVVQDSSAGEDEVIIAGAGGDERGEEGEGCPLVFG